MQFDKQNIIQACDFIESRITKSPKTGILTGTGLSDIIDNIKIDAQLEYTDIPHFPASTVESHKGTLVTGTVKNKDVLVMQGRFHLYEGYTPEQVTFPVRVMQHLGVEKLVLCNAAGGINLEFNSGDIMMIMDHINLTGRNPLVGPNHNDWGIRFPDMTKVYDPELSNIAQEAAKKNKIKLQKGIYAGLLGPSLETPAETRYLKTIGADAVGFSTIMEAIAGVHAGMKILGLSLITNINDPENPEETTLESVLQTARQAMGSFNQLIYDILLK